MREADIDAALAFWGVGASRAENYANVYGHEYVSDKAVEADLMENGLFPGGPLLNKLKLFYPDATVADLAPLVMEAKAVKALLVSPEAQALIDTNGFDPVAEAFDLLLGNEVASAITPGRLRVILGEVYGAELGPITDDDLRIAMKVSDANRDGVLDVGDMRNMLSQALKVLSVFEVVGPS